MVTSVKKCVKSKYHFNKFGQKRFFVFIYFFHGIVSNVVIMSQVQLEMLSNFALNENLVQIIDSTTWSRIFNGNMKPSLLDHVYVTYKMNMSRLTPLIHKC